jgi:ATP-dependent DNA helicase RecG
LELVAETAKRRSTQVVEAHRKELLLQSPRQILSAFGLLSLNDGKPNIAALLLFGKSEILKARLPNHEIQYHVFGPRGEVLRNVSFTGPIASIFPKLLELPELLLNSDEFRFRGANVVIPEYPEDSRREALANAIVHRDYTLLPSVQIQLFEKELILTNPGSFLTGVTLSNLLSVPPTPRNRRLAEAMRDFGFVESSGRGIDYIFQGQAKFGRPAPDYTGSDADRVSVRLTGGKANLDFCRFALSSTENPSILEVLLLNALFFHRDLTLEQLSSVIQRPATVTHEILAKLRQDKLIEMNSDRVPRYLLKGSVNHSAMKAVKPVRLSRIQIEQFKLDLLSELQRESPNTLASLADRVGLSPSQTRRLLIQLRDQKKIRMLAGKKWQLGVG